MIEFDGVRLRGFDEAIPCYCFEDSADIVSYLSEAVGIIFALAGSGPAYNVLKDAMCDRQIRGTVVLLTPRESANVLADEDPEELLIRAAREQLGIKSLNPYSSSSPARPNMFFGRRDVRGVARDENASLICVSGRNGCGKTSFLMYVADEMKNSKGHVGTRTLFLDAKKPNGIVPPADPATAGDAVSSALAQMLDKSVGGVRSSKLGAFLMNWLDSSRERLNICLDNADSVSDKDLFNALASLANDGRIRLMISAEDGPSFIARQLAGIATPEVLLLGRLSEDEAKQMIDEPLSQLGLSLFDQSVMDYAISWSQKWPDALQVIGEGMVRYCVASGTNVVHLERLLAHVMERGRTASWEEPSGMSQGI